MGNIIYTCALIKSESYVLTPDLKYEACNMVWNVSV